VLGIAVLLAMIGAIAWLEQVPYERQAERKESTAV
jgi:hypothetical protein